jgi:hypothetical protein
MVSTSDNSSTDPRQFKPLMAISRYTLGMLALPSDLSFAPRRVRPATARGSGA